MDREEIMARLAAGETLDDIAAEMSKTLNEAAALYKQEQEKNNYDYKILMYAEELADHINEFIMDCYPQYKKFVVNGEDIVNFMNSIQDMINLFNDLGEFYNKE